MAYHRTDNDNYQGGEECGETRRAWLRRSPARPDSVTHGNAWLPRAVARVSMASPSTASNLPRWWRRSHASCREAATDEELEALDRWRAERGTRALAARGIDAALQDVLLQRLVRQPQPITTPDPYALNPFPEEPGVGMDWMPDDTGIDAWRVRLEPVGVSPAVPQSRPAALRTRALVASHPPALLAGNSLHVPTHGAYLTKRHGTLVVRRQKTHVFECAFDDVRHVAVEAEGVGLSGSVLAELARRRVSVLICGGSGVPLARIVPVRNETRPALAEKQVALRTGIGGTRVASQLLASKIFNQRALLLYHSKYASRPTVVRQHLVEAAQQLERAVQELDQHCHLPLPVARTTLLLIEARAAIVYWRAFGSLVPESYGFTGRRKRDARDAVNAALNYGYWVLMARSWQALEKQGLHPYIGLLHTSRHDLPGLVRSVSQRDVETVQAGCRRVMAHPDSPHPSGRVVSARHSPGERSPVGSRVLDPANARTKREPWTSRRSRCIRRALRARRRHVERTAVGRH